ncbi:MAG: hypothetical protein K2K55_01240 [Duncaniella sp.]|nr:hypothetical protein [Duncaniella sp.]
MKNRPPLLTRRERLGLLTLLVVIMLIVTTAVAFRTRGSIFPKKTDHNESDALVKMTETSEAVNLDTVPLVPMPPVKERSKRRKPARAARETTPPKPRNPLDETL